MIVGARLVGASVTRVVEVIGVSRSSVSLIRSQYAKTGKHLQTEVAVIKSQSLM